MGLVDIVIIAAVAAALAFCVRRLARGGAGGCGDCASSSSCSARATGEGTCRVAKDMVARADAALREKGPRQGPK
ncbi:MAG: FeoB-associated Cys-rich membrane protein [Olsenella sp.]|nr:FeoB-associated Cys-rich membrane protein [Olsenella sp.]